MVPCVRGRSGQPSQCHSRRCAQTGVRGGHLGGDGGERSRQKQKSVSWKESVRYWPPESLRYGVSLLMT